MADGLFDVNLDQLNASILSNVSSAVNAILFTTLVFTSGETAARDWSNDSRYLPSAAPNLQFSLQDHIGVDPTTEDDGGWCTPAGCYIWANIFDPSGGGGGWGGGSGGTGSSSGGRGPPITTPAIPISQLPDVDKLKCAVAQYGLHPVKYVWSIDDVWAFNQGRNEYISVDTPLPPPGYVEDEAITNTGSDWAGGGQTILFAAGVSAHRDGFSFRDPNTHAMVTIPGPFTAFEWGLVTLAHEIAHQNDVVSENDAEYFGNQALQAYRGDHGKKCP